ncbi:MAG TPA: phosphoribosylformylglycinamidine cyclo-ligase, partial [Saprospiraceae bacterium]|nr:phosphoribosylformylglycinamidine cyclo-ligase [Saprospiraceae bacterium]
MTSRYDSLGVSANKNEVHKAISKLSKGLYPNAFCKILEDIVTQDKEYCNIMHADTAGTKTSLAYLAYQETGDLSVWKGISQDAIVMNIDDLACVGCVDNIILSSTIGRNKSLIPAEIINEIISANQSFIDKLKEYQINIISGGGETADVGDIVRTIDVGITAFARMKREDLIINNIQAGAVIVGFSSSGQASYEDEYNSGIGSNGLTAARHDVLTKIYASQYPESFSPELNPEVVFTGTKKLTDTVKYDGKEYLVYKLLCSPTRTYLPVISKILQTHKKSIQGIIHCSGGAQTKVLKFAKNVKIIKDNLFDLPPVFQLIKSEMKYSLKELYSIYNMGHRLEMYVNPESVESIINISKSFHIDAKIIG